MIAHIKFSSGHCFMTEPLSAGEVELVGPLILEHLKTEDGQENRRSFDRILKKMDYPTLGGELK
jgi:hypothetical protein